MELIVNMSASHPMQSSSQPIYMLSNMTFIVSSSNFCGISSIIVFVTKSFLLEAKEPQAPKRTLTMRILRKESATPDTVYNQSHYCVAAWKGGKC